MIIVIFVTSLSKSQDPSRKSQEATLSLFAVTSNILADS